MTEAKQEGLPGTRKSAGRRIRQGAGRRRRTGRAVYHLFMTVGCFVMVYPLLWMLFSSFKPNSEIFVHATRLFPMEWTFEHYTTGWKGFARLTFATFFGNSFFLSGISVIGTVLSSTLIAFGFARIPFAGRRFWFALMIVTMMLPSQVLMIPLFVLFKNLGWVGSFLPILVPTFFGNAFYVFLIMQFVRGIPRDMDEAAMIDGCGWPGIFFRIVLPMVTPALATVAIMTFMGSWSDFMGALLYLNKPSMYPVAYALKLFSDESSTDFGATFAMSVLSLVPILLLFFAFQKSLVEGISTQGLKG